MKPQLLVLVIAKALTRILSRHDIDTYISEAEGHLSHFFDPTISDSQVIENIRSYVLNTHSVSIQEKDPMKFFMALGSLDPDKYHVTTPIKYLISKSDPVVPALEEIKEQIIGPGSPENLPDIVKKWCEKVPKLDSMTTLELFEESLKPYMMTWFAKKYLYEYIEKPDTNNLEPYMKAYIDSGYAQFKKIKNIKPKEPEAMKESVTRWVESRFTVENLVGRKLKDLFIWKAKLPGIIVKMILAMTGNAYYKEDYITKQNKDLMIKRISFLSVVFQQMYAQQKAEKIPESSIAYPIFQSIKANTDELVGKVLPENIAEIFNDHPQKKSPAYELVREAATARTNIMRSIKILI